MRPNGASASMPASNTRPPAISSTTSTGRPPLASTRRVGEVVRGDVDGGVGAELERASSRFSADDAVAITRPAPSALPSCTASEPTPPAAA